MSSKNHSSGIGRLITSIQDVVRQAGTGKINVIKHRKPEPNTYSCGEQYIEEIDLTKEQRLAKFEMINELVSALKDRVLSTGPSIKRAELSPEEKEIIIRDVIVPEIESHKSRWPNGPDGSAVERIEDYKERKSCHVFCDPDGDAESIIAGCLESECSGGEIDEGAINALLEDEKRDIEFARRREEREAKAEATKMASAVADVLWPR